MAWRGAVPAVGVLVVVLGRPPPMVPPHSPKSICSVPGGRAGTGKLARDDLIAKDIGVNEWRGGYAPPLTSLQSGLCNSMQRYPAHHKSPHPLDPWGEGLDGALACHGYSRWL
jgi:hypothetical protein